MKGNTKTYRKLIEIVNDALSDYQLGQQHQFQFLRWGMKYAEELHFDHLRDIRTVRLNMQPWKAVELPSDCVDWVAVGLQYGSDIAVFANEKNIALEFDLDPTTNQQLPNSEPSYLLDESRMPEVSDAVFPFLNLSALGEDAGNKFGLMVKDNGLGYVTENTNKDVNELQFKGSNIKTDSQVYLMYISNLWDPSEETLIHPEMAEYIVAGISKEYVQRKATISGIEKQMTKDEFDRQYLKVLDRTWELTVADVIEYVKQSYRMTPKIP
jgi:hypothetical protein